MKMAMLQLNFNNNEKSGVTIVDEEDYYDLIKHKWFIRDGYVTALIDRKKIQIHRYILKYNGKLIVDHRDGITYNNKKSNLRLVTQRENTQNKSSAKGSSSKFIGVSKKRNKWRCAIQVNGKSIHLGTFTNEEDAAKTRDIATKKYFGDFGRLNFVL
jgi:hypothetical protein